MSWLTEGRGGLERTLLIAKRYNEALQPFVKRLQNNGLAPKAIVGAVMRKLVHIIFGVLKSNSRFNPKMA